MRSQVDTTQRFVGASLIGVLGLVAACGGGASAPPPKTEEQPEHPRDDGPVKAVSPSVEVVNGCANAVHVYFGETPNGTTGSHNELRGGSTSHIARGPDGTLTVWIEDEKGFGLAHVKVTRRMSKAEIGASCGTLHAE
jgi:hypothetical protein